MLPKSNTLFHFTRSIDYLKNILLNGFFPRYCLEDAAFLDIDYAGYPMVCFCDIPISRISEHTSFYGDYGIGLTKDWGIRSQLVPIVYTPPTGPAAELAKFLIDVDLKPKNRKHKDINDDLILHFNKFIPLLKPLSGRMFIDGKLAEKEFYQENEWRYLPDDFEMILGETEFSAKKDALNSEMEAHSLKFSTNDIRYIFVKRDSELPILFDFIQNSLGMYPLNDLKILSTRITSLETLSRDL